MDSKRTEICVWIWLNLGASKTNIQVKQVFLLVNQIWTTYELNIDSVEMVTNLQRPRGGCCDRRAVRWPVRRLHCIYPAWISTCCVWHEGKAVPMCRWASAWTPDRNTAPTPPIPGRRCPASGCRSTCRFQFRFRILIRMFQPPTRPLLSIHQQRLGLVCN